MQHVNQTIAEFLTGKVANTIQAGATVLEAVAAMIPERHGYVLVMDGEALIGIFTDRDFLNRVLAERRLPGQTPVRDVMTPAPDTLKRSDYISYAIERMACYGFRNIPVADDEGPLAVLTIWMVMMHLSEILDEVKEAERDNEILSAVADIGGG